MIRNEAEYQEASERLGDELKRLDEHRARLKDAGLGDAEVKRVIDPLESFHLPKSCVRASGGGFAQKCHGSLVPSLPRSIFTAVCVTSAWRLSYTYGGV